MICISATTIRGSFCNYDEFRGSVFIFIYVFQRLRYPVRSVTTMSSAVRRWISVYIYICVFQRLRYPVRSVTTMSSAVRRWISASRLVTSVMGRSTARIPPTRWDVVCLDTVILCSSVAKAGN